MKNKIKHIGYVGLGIMGEAMAQNLLKAGFAATVWNRTPDKAAPLLAAGATWADSAADLAGNVDALCVNVTDTPDVEQVIFGEGGIVEGANSGLVVIDHSTISPAATRDFAKRLAKRGIDLLDAPVSGGDIGARNGSLSVMVGGDADVFKRCLCIFEAVGGAITHCGPSGTGQTTKACNQILCAVNLAAVCEAMALAKREGLDLKKMLSVTTAGASASWSLANLGPRIAEDDMAPGFMVDLLNKDMAIVADEAGALGLPLPATQLAAKLLRDTAEAGHGRSGTQALCKIFEQMGNFQYAQE